MESLKNILFLDLTQFVQRRIPEATYSSMFMRKPDMSKVEWSEAQTAHCQRFRETQAYAAAAMASPEVRAQYEKLAEEKDKRPRDLAMSDFFKGNNLLTVG
jgi:hypothetical protein